MIDVVIALIEKDNKICVGQRKSKPFKGYLECPGGKVEINESLLEGLKRELKEEGDAVIKEAYYITHYIVDNEHGLFRLHWFKTSLINDFKPIIYDEILWVDVDELYTLNWIEHNIPYIPMMKKALTLKSQELYLDQTNELECLKLLQDDNILIKNIHLKKDGHHLDQDFINLFPIIID